MKTTEFVIIIPDRIVTFLNYSTKNQTWPNRDMSSARIPSNKVSVNIYTTTYDKLDKHVSACMQLSY